MKKIFLSVLALGTIVLILFDAPKAILYTKDAMYLCCEMIVPTLFPFFVCSAILIYSGFSKWLSYIFRFCMKPLFNVSPSGAAAFVLGIISGYPLGAVTAGELYKNSYISKTEAERLLAFCNNSGPLFILGSIGVAMYTEIKYGIILYLIHILSAITVGVIFRFYRYHSYSAPKTYFNHNEDSAGNIFNIALDNSIKNILTICGAVIIFSMASRLLMDLIPLSPISDAFISGLLEFVTGSVKIFELDISIMQKLCLTAVIVGFAGLCVHIQVIAVISKYELSLVPYFIGKILHALLSGFYIYIYFSMNPITTAVFSPSISKTLVASSLSELVSAGILVSICVIFSIIYYIKNKDKKALDIKK